MSDQNTGANTENTKPKRYRRRRRRRPRNKNKDEQDNQPMFNNKRDYPPLQLNNKPTYASTARNWGRCDDPQKSTMGSSTQHVRQKTSMFAPASSTVRYTSSSVTIFTRAHAGSRELDQLPHFC